MKNPFRRHESGKDQKQPITREQLPLEARFVDLAPRPQPIINNEKDTPPNIQAAHKIVDARLGRYKTARASVAALGLATVAAFGVSDVVQDRHIDVVPEAAVAGLAAGGINLALRRRALGDGERVIGFIEQQAREVYGDAWEDSPPNSYTPVARGGVHDVVAAISTPPGGILGIGAFATSIHADVTTGGGETLGIALEGGSALLAGAAIGVAATTGIWGERRLDDFAFTAHERLDELAGQQVATAAISAHRV